ncbi:MAG: bacteriohemerythrin [Gammaproteobacteria bacterium]|nr:bacteriohemerythrin [Gammaproteobacteria bacterium]
MAMVEWSNAYSVDIQEIDEQHKCLIDIMNDLYTALVNNSNRDLIGDVLDKLVDYTKVHFSVEETLMRIFEYDGYEAHKEKHDRIVAKVLTYQGQFRGGNDKVGMELLLFLKDWLFNHINTVDKAYTKTFHKAGVKKRWLKKFW